MSTKETTIISKSLFSGSSDTLRTDIGAFWSVVEDGSGNTDIEFSRVNLSSTDSVFLNSVISQPENIVELDNETFIPNISLPVRITGKEYNIDNDDQWRTALTGGVWADTLYVPIVDQNIPSEYIKVATSMPYTRLEHNIIGSSRVSDFITVGYDYNQYLRQYQSKISRGNITEYQLPNYYIIADLQQWSTTTDVANLYPQKLIDYVSLDGKYNDINNLFQFSNGLLPYVPSTAVLTLFEDIRKNNTNLSVDYLTGAYVEMVYSGSTSDWASTRLRNVLFDNNAINYFDNTEPLFDCLPYKININFRRMPSGRFLNAINDNNFSSKFIKTLYMAFGNNINELQPNETNYSLKQNYFEAEEGAIYNVKNTRDAELKEIDYIKFLSYCRNNYDTTDENQNCIFIGPRDLYRASAQEESGIYRHVNTQTTIPVLKDTVDYLQNLIDSTYNNIASFLKNNNTYEETIAYRVEKIGGSTSGDFNQQQALQNFWFLNSNTGDFNFYDSQVKYDTDYTYNVYAYKLFVGIRYQKNDLIVTRQIGCQDGDLIGLEFYDPATGDAVPEIYESVFQRGRPVPYNGYKPLNAETTYGTTSQILSPNKYVADFNLEYEPFIKIVEVPLINKSIRINDHPGNELVITPYTNEKSDNTVGFRIDTGVFRETNFPNIITSADQRYRQNYLNANDLTEESIIELESISSPSTIEVYRLEQRPQTVTDFNGALRKTVNLTLADNTDVSKNTSFTEDLVSVNKKYYYLFRVLNQLQEISHVSRVYEIQLVDDGGYKYNIVNVINIEELEEEDPSTVSRSFKKLLQLRPNIQQVLFDTSDVDFTKSAYEQINNLKVGQADELIWDKTFKLRLTSKKTSRKIDLNITYKLIR
jgi:hypothetical protein